MPPFCPSASTYLTLALSVSIFAAAAQHLHHNADRLKPKRSFLQSIFCCWRKARTKTTQNGTPIDGTITPPPAQGSQKYLLPQVRHSDMHKKCMVIDLDETLVHSSFKVSNTREYCICGGGLINDILSTLHTDTYLTASE